MKLPPGQVETRKFPVVGERRPAPGGLDLERFRLRIDGRVERPLELGWAEVMAFPQAERVVAVHCVTGWSRGATRFTGFPLRFLLERARPLASARFVRFEACSERRHDTSLPLELAREDTWLVHRVDGRPLAPEHGYPLRTVTPSRYFYKSLKWVRRVELLDEDRPGYWERESSYHPRGDPWAGNERFISGSVDPVAVARFRDATSFDRYRGPRKTMIGLDLAGWRPRSRDLRELHLKSSDLRGADFEGADLRGANLSLSDLRGARLARADLRDADLEGCDLAGADLRGADLRRTALSAARFVSPDGGDGARIRGLRLEGSRGLLEDQEEFLYGRSGHVEGGDGHG